MRALIEQRERAGLGLAQDALDTVAEALGASGWRGILGRCRLGHLVDCYGALCMHGTGTSWPAPCFFRPGHDRRAVGPGKEWTLGQPPVS